MSCQDTAAAALNCPLQVISEPGSDSFEHLGISQDVKPSYDVGQETVVFKST